MQILSASNFGAIDWGIVLVYVVISGAVGLLCRRYIRNIGDYLVAGRSVGPFLAVATLSSTEMGLVTVMYMAEFGYKNGFSAFLLGIIMAAVMVFLGATGFIVRRFRATGAVTVAEYYQQRYSRRVRIVGGFIIATAGILNMGLFPKMAGKFIKHFTGVSPTISLGPYTWDAAVFIMGALLVIVVLYTVLGGMVSVVFTDYLQFLVLALGLGAATYYCLEAYSWPQMCQALTARAASQAQADPVDPFNPFRSLGLLWMGWQVALCVGAWSAWQPVAFRTSATDNEKTTRPMFVFSGLTMVARAVIPMLWGIGALTYFMATAPQRIAPGGDIGSLDAMPLFLAHIVPTVAAGVLMSGMVAAFMSTFDSYLLAWSGVIVQDIIAPLRRVPLSGRARVVWSRALVVGIAAFLFFWSLFYNPPETVWHYMALTGTSYVSGALALLVGGLYWKRASRTGAMLALVFGAVIPIGNMFVGQLLQRWGVVAEPPISSELAGLGAYVIAGAAMVVGSLIWPNARPTRSVSPPAGPDGGS